MWCLSNESSFVGKSQLPILYGLSTIVLDVSLCLPLCVCVSQGRFLHTSIMISYSHSPSFLNFVNMHESPFEFDTFRGAIQTNEWTLLTKHSHLNNQIINFIYTNATNPNKFIALYFQWCSDGILNCRF